MMLTDYEISQAMNARSLNGGNDDSPWWLLFARDVERLAMQHGSASRKGAWKEGFAACNDWRQTVDEFWRTHEYGDLPAAPSNPWA